MQGVAAGLAGRGYHVHSLDLPGFGRSQTPPGGEAAPWGVPEYARFVVHYLESAGLKPARLVGHSFGGRISIVLGADYADYVTQIVLADSAGVLSPPTARDALVGLGKAALRLPILNRFEAGLRKLGREMLGSADLKDAGALEYVFRRVVEQDLVPYAARIKAPTLLVWGDQDQDTPLWQGQTLEKTIPDAGLVVFAGAGHFAYQERLTDFVHIVDTFFKSQP
jgi:pimeloyl-ACP methyl ester carboxylesterase